MFLKVQPPGVNPILPSDRSPLIKFVNGDTWTIDMNLKEPVSCEPAKPDNSIVKFVLTENRFVYDAYWIGEWHNGIEPDSNIPGLVHVHIPENVSSTLRRGVYAFSVKVSEPTGLDTNSSNLKEVTAITGHIQVEYEPTSDEHNIPYRGNSYIDENIGPTDSEQVKEHMHSTYAKKSDLCYQIAPMPENGILKNRMIYILGNVNTIRPPTSIDENSFNAMVYVDIGHTGAFNLEFPKYVSENNDILRIDADKRYIFTFTLISSDTWLISKKVLEYYFESPPISTNKSDTH